MSDSAVLRAARCVDDLHLSASPVEFGYKVQALAAHVLLRLGFVVTEINRSGHPDIVATMGMSKFHFEVEAEVSGPRLRKLTKEDYSALTGLPNVTGYFALAIGFPTPRWVVVPAERLKHRKPSSNVVLEALEDTDFSHAWTHAYVDLLKHECTRIGRTAFRELCKRALSGRGL